MQHSSNNQTGNQISARLDETKITFGEASGDAHWTRYFAGADLTGKKTIKIRFEPKEPSESVKRRPLGSSTDQAPLLISASDLERLSTGDVPISGLVLTCPNLLRLSARALRTPAFSLSHQVLVRLSLTGSSINQLQISDCPALETINVSGCGLNQLTIERTPALLSVNCSRNGLARLSLVQEQLETLECQNNQLVELNLICASLQSLNCSQNQLQTWEITVCPKLERVTCHENPLTNLPGLENSTRIAEIFLPETAKTAGDKLQEQFFRMRVMYYNPRRNMFYREYPMPPEMMRSADLPSLRDPGEQVSTRVAGGREDMSSCSRTPPNLSAEDMSSCSRTPPNLSAEDMSSRCRTPPNLLAEDMPNQEQPPLEYNSRRGMFYRDFPAGTPLPPGPMVLNPLQYDRACKRLALSLYNEGQSPPDPIILPNSLQYDSRRGMPYRELPSGGRPLPPGRVMNQDEIDGTAPEEQSSGSGPRVHRGPSLGRQAE